MLPIFKAGLGGKLGHGRQYMSWIAIDDLTAALQYALEDERFMGAVNFVAPEPVTNKDFTRALASELGKPAFLPVPGFVLKCLPGGQARETVLASQRVEPYKLRRAGFKFEFPDVSSALHHVLRAGR